MEKRDKNRLGVDGSSSRRVKPKHHALIVAGFVIMAVMFAAVLVLWPVSHLKTFDVQISHVWIGTSSDSPDDPPAALRTLRMRVARGSVRLSYDRVNSTRRGLMGFGVFQAGFDATFEIYPSGQPIEPDYYNGISDWQYLGAAFRLRGGPQAQLMMEIPLVVPGLLAGACGFVMYRRIVEVKRRASGKCVRCGYSLVDIKDAERCPECGSNER